MSDHSVGVTWFLATAISSVHLVVLSRSHLVVPEFKRFHPCGRRFALVGGEAP